MSEAVKRRRYRSPRRAEQAEQTRERILAAAMTRFARAGYVATTIADVAAEAGVAAPTIYTAIGTKPAILAELITRAIAGRDASGLPVRERSFYRAIVDLDDPVQLLRVHTANMVAINRRVAPVQRIAEGAAGADPELAALWKSLSVDQRMRGQRVVAQLLHERGWLAPGMTVETAADIIWTLIDGRLYESLVMTRGWSQTRFTHWLFETLRHALLDPPA